MDINKKRFGDLSRCALVKQGLLLWVVIYTLIRPRLGNQQCPFDVDFDKTLHHLVIASFLLITQESSSTCFFCGLLVSHPASCKLYGLLMSKTKHLYICFGLLLPAVFFPERPSQRLFFFAQCGIYEHPATERFESSSHQQCGAYLSTLSF